MLRDHLADYVAITLWTVFALCATVFRHDVPPQQCSFVGTATLSATGWALARHYRGPKLKPGERVISSEQERELELALTRAIVAGYRAEGEPPQSVRAVRLG